MPLPLISRRVFVLIFTFFFCLALAGGRAMLFDPDTGWHLSAGAWILKHGAVPAADPFSYTAGDTPWINVSWLWDALMSLLNQRFGLWGPVVASALTGALTLALLARLMLERGAGVIVTLVASVLAYIAFAPHFTVRPHLVSYLLLAVFLTVLPRGGRAIWVLPLLMILWVNCHGGFVAGFLAIGAFGAQALLERNMRRFTRLAAIGTLCLAATLANPYGLGLYELFFRTFGGTFMQHVNEWLPVRFTFKGAQHALLPGLILLLIVPAWRHLSVAERLLTVFWLLATLASRRHMSVLALTALPGMAYGVTMLMRAGTSHLAGVLRQRESAYASAFTSPRAARLLYPATALALLLAPLPFTERLTFKGGPASFPLTRHPVEAVEFLQTHYPCARLANVYNYGGYVIYATNGEMKVMIDGRAESAYPRQTVQEYLKFHALREDAREVLESYRADVALVPAHAEYRVFFASTPGWRSVYSDALAEIWARREACPRDAE